ncbi:MAG: hypothetical protein JW918_10730 [Anaerolineae bacterium]|nr:hypothetical protein [Anaerolineae bacterium]
MGGMKNQVEVAALSSLRQRARSLLVVIFLALLLLALSFVLLQVTTSRAAGTLTVEIISAYNLVVDSNVGSTSTYAPSVATVAGRFCNTGDDDLTNVQGYIGNYVDGSNDTPGVYPARTVNAAFTTEHPALDNATGSAYSFTHVGGRLGAADATRFIGTLAPDECVMQYWHFTYPQCELNADGSVDLPPCDGANSPVWGESIKPGDDLWLDFDIWGSAYDGTITQIADETRTMTMRNEISAMANKIEPNPDGRWFNTEGNTVVPGDVITSNGILYTFGNVRHGFDNDGDYVPDYNAWAQPIGDTSYDPSCFRLIHTSGVLTVTRGGGNPDLIIPFDDRDPSLSEPYGGPLYFTNLPSDNTSVNGEVYYTFLALDGPCSTSLTPYQEVASGYDNEKFNGDYGVGIPPVGSSEPEVTISKASDPNVISLGSTTTYRIPFANSGTSDFGLGLSSGTGMGMMIGDTVPAGTVYVAGSATAALSYAGSVTIRYSTDSGRTWSLTGPTADTRSSSPDELVVIQWWLDDPLPAGSSGNYAEFQVFVPSDALPPAYSGSYIENCAEAGLGDGAPFEEVCAITLITGPNSVGDRVWQDDDNDAVQDGGETSIGSVTVWLYLDLGTVGALDSSDRLISTTVTSSSGNNYLFDNLPDGNYLVKVDKEDSDIPTGHRITTPEVYAVDLDSAGTDANPVDYLDADFGFGPALSLSKGLASGDPALEGDVVTYTIVLTNNRPGDGSGEEQACTYTTWPSQCTGGTGGKAWTSPENALGAPDSSEAIAPFADSSEGLQLFGWDLGTKPGGVTKVEVVLWIRRSGADPGTDQDMTVRLLDGATEISSRLYTGDVFSTTSSAFVIDVTDDRAWTWADFGSSSNIRIELVAKKQGNPNFDMHLDAAGFRVSNGLTCNDPADTIDPLPLTDTYDDTKLQFLSASPAETVVSGGVITWTNVGPLYPGQTLTVTVLFEALQPPDSDVTPDGEPDPTTHQNCADSVGGTFLDGDDTNDPAQSCVTHGIDPAGAIGDYVWNDLDGDGVQDAGEPGIPGVTVYLCTSATCNSGTAIATDVTDGSGLYLFEALTDGTYYVAVDTSTLPGSTFTQTGDPDEAGTCSACDSQSSATINSNDGNPATDDDLLRDFGYQVPNALFGNVFEDNDNDAAWDQPGENGFNAITVYLDNCGPDGICGTGDDTTQSTTTDATGYYFFGDLPDGTYRVRVDTATLPAGATWSNTVDPEGSPGDDQTSAIAISGGNIYGPYDFGYYRTGTYSLGDTVYVDWNGDGDQDSGEEGIPNISVYLYQDDDGDGVVDPDTDPLLATDVTDASGEYGFTNLPAQSYIVVVDTGDADFPANHQQTQDPDEDPGVCTTCDSDGSATLGPDDDTLDFGYQPIGAGSIGDFVWQDDDGDGVQDPGEPGIPGILVTLYEDSNNDGVIDSGDAVVATVTTDSNGEYLFTGLPAGDYLVDVDTTDGDLPTDGSAPYVLSTNNDPHDVALSAGEEYLDADFGFTTGGVIGDTVYRDTNVDGQQDIGEPGIGGVTVGLYTWTDVDGDGIYNAITDTLSVTPLATDVTDADGLYLFSGLPAGDYVVKVESGVPSGYNQSGDPDWLTPCSGSGLCDGASGVHLRAGQTDLSRDFGYYPLGLIGDTLWIDTDGDGTRDEDESGIPYVTVTLYDDVNTNGVYDPGTDTLYDTTETNSDGYYYFGGMPVPDHYVVVVNTADTDFPAGLTQTYDPDGTLDDQAGASLTGGNYTDLTRDFGYQYDGDWSISGTVFYDDDGNGGLYNPGAGDTPFAGIPVYLRNSAGLLIGTTTTDSNGYYVFDDLPNGDYTVAVGEIPNLATQTRTYEPDGTGGDGLCEVGDPCNNNATPVTINNANVIDQDFGYYGGPPTAVTLSLFEAGWQEGRVVVTWETAMEVNTVGFNLWRSASPDGAYEQVNARLIPAASLGGVWGGSYSFTDTGVFPGRAYYYELEELEVGGQRNWYGPVSTGGDAPTRVTFSNAAASGGAAGIWWLAGAAAALSLPPLLIVRLWRRRR